MAPVYQYLNRAQARQQLANRLYDSGQVFWISAELNLYIAEALRTWNAMTSFWRGDFIFSAAPNTRWYDITNPATAPNSLRLPALKDTDLYTLMQYHLLEPAVGVNPWTGASAQFSADDLISATQRRRDEVLGVTGCTTTLRTVGAVLGRIVLPDTVIDVRRMAYLPAVGSPSIVWKDDTWALQAFNTGYPQAPAGTPVSYQLSTEPPISFDTDRPPGFAGSYELLTVEAGQSLSAGSASLLSVPDDWTHVVKWGALADLFSRESNARDPLRAQYCNQRYQMGVKLLASAPAILAMRIGNAVLQIDSVADADAYRTGWEGEAPGAPNGAFYSGLNLVGVAPIPDTNPYSFTVTVVENAPVPSTDGDFLQVARDDIDVVLDYAQHLAAFKMGGAEFTATMPLLERFLTKASISNAKLKEMGEFTTALYALGQVQEHRAPRIPEEALG